MINKIVFRKKKRFMHLGKTKAVHINENMATGHHQFVFDYAEVLYAEVHWRNGLFLEITCLLQHKNSDCTAWIKYIENSSYSRYLPL